MKAYINRKPVSGPWGGGNLFVKAFLDHAGATPGVELVSGAKATPNVILLAGIDWQGPDAISAEQAIMYRMYMDPTCKIVLRVNDNDARKGTKTVDEMLLKVSAHVDSTVFVSAWLQRHFNDRGWSCKDQHVIVNGVDLEAFKPQPKLDNGKLNVVAHHWSDNPLKGADVYERLDELVGAQPDLYTFTFIGRTKSRFKHTRLVHPLQGKALGEELGKHDIYVSASRHDPGPNHVLEALACRLPTYVIAEGGGCVEFAGHDHSFRDWNDLEAILSSCRPPLSSMIDNTALVPTTWQACVAEYNRVLEATWQGSTSGSHIS